MTWESLSHLLESAASLLGQIGAAVGLLVLIIVFIGIVTGAAVRQKRKRRGIPEYVPEHPAVSRLASKEEIEALISRAGIRVVKKEDAHG